MKKFILLGLLVVSFTLYAQEQAIITEFSGKVEVMQPGKGWSPAVKNLVVSPGTTISTGFNSRAVLDLGSSSVQVKALTRLTLSELLKKEGVVTTNLALRVGGIRAQVKTAEGLDQKFVVKSPLSTAAVRGTEFDMTIDRLNVIIGSIEFSNALEIRRSVMRGEQSAVTANAAPASPEVSLMATTTTSISTTPAGGGEAAKAVKTKLGGDIKITVQ
jgi:hypothetical protein